MKKYVITALLVSITVTAWAGEECLQERLQIQTLKKQNGQLLIQAAGRMITESSAEEERLQKLMKPDAEPAPDAPPPTAPDAPKKGTP